MSDIRDPWAFVLGRWAWGRGGYDAVFPRGCQIGDIDGFLELGGLHLFVEAKDWHGGKGDPPALPTGQRKALESLCRHPGQIVFLLWGCAHLNRPYVVDVLRGWPPVTVRHDWRAVPDEEARANLRALLSHFAALGQGAT
jgi:hypothetical protein